MLADRRNDLVLAHRRFQADTVVLVHREKVVDHVEPLFPRRVVDRGDVDQRVEKRQAEFDFRNSTASTMWATATRTVNSPPVTSYPRTASGLRDSINAPRSFKASLIGTWVLIARCVPVRRIFR